MLQNALLQIVRGLSSFRQDARLTTWIFRITENEALMLLRARRRSAGRVVAGLVLEELGSLPGMHDPHEADDVLCAARKAARVHREVARLPSNYRTALVAHYLDELDLGEASERLGVSTAAVKARLWRARKSMRAALVKVEPQAALASGRARSRAWVNERVALQRARGAPGAPAPGPPRTPRCPARGRSSDRARACA